MELKEKEIIQEYTKLCGHCRRVTLVPYEAEFTSVACGNNVIKRKHLLTKISRKQSKF